MQILSTQPMDGATQSTLDCGIAWILADDSALLIIDAIAARDLPHAIRAGSLIPRALALRARSPWSYLLVVGGLFPLPSNKTAIDGEPTGWEWASIQGALLSVQEAGVGVLYVRSEKDVAQSIQSLATRSRTSSRVLPPRDMLFATDGEALLQTLPGIGPDKCEALLKACRTPAAALQALTYPEAPGIPGIGPETQNTVKKTLGLRPGDWLTVVATNEDRTP
jgi:ERCC4-type nuclease